MPVGLQQSVDGETYGRSRETLGRGNPLAQLVPVASADVPADEETDGRSQRLMVALSTVVPVGLQQSVDGETYSLGTARARRFSSCSSGRRD